MVPLFPVVIVLLLGTSHCMTTNRHAGVDHYGDFEAQLEGGIYEDLPGAFGDGEFNGDPYMHYDYHVGRQTMMPPERPRLPKDYSGQRSQPSRSTRTNGQKAWNVQQKPNDGPKPQTLKQLQRSPQKRQVDPNDPNCNTTSALENNKKPEPNRFRDTVNSRRGNDQMIERRRTPSNLRENRPPTQASRTIRPLLDDRQRSRPSGNIPRRPPQIAEHRHGPSPASQKTQKGGRPRILHDVLGPRAPTSSNGRSRPVGSPRAARPPQEAQRPAHPKSFDELPSPFKTGLANLLQLLSVQESGRQILIKLNILEQQPVTKTQQSRERMSLTPNKAGRLLRLLSSMKSSKSGKDLLYQLDLAEFMNLPKRPPRVDASGKRIMNHEVPTTLDFTAYNYNGGGGCVDELMRDTMKKNPQPRRFKGALDELYSRTPGFLTTEMDMVLTDQQWRDFYGSMPPGGQRVRGGMNRAPVRNRRKAIKEKRYYWPDKSVPYILDDNEFNWSDIMLLERAMYEWEQSTCVRFRLALPSDVNKIRFRSGQGCSSHVGMIGGTQNITLQGPCRIRRIVLHEIGHSLGLVHEHQRPDRDNYIQILYANARPGTDWDFQKRTWGTVVNHTVAYDYMSVMHYGPKAFSMDQQKPTIITRDSTYQETIGKVTELSFNDKKLVNMMYKCSEHCPKKIECQHGGYVNKNCKCVCPSTHPNCLVQDTRVDRPEPGQVENSWMKLFQTFSWNALNSLGLGNNIRPNRPTTSRAPYIDHRDSLLEMLDSPIRNRRPQPLSLSPAQHLLQRSSRRRSRPQMHIFHGRIKRETGETPLSRVKRFLGVRARPRVRTRNSFLRRRPVYRRRKFSSQRKLPRLSRKYFRSISENDKEARMKEIRYNTRRRRYEREMKRSRNYWR